MLNCEQCNYLKKLSFEGKEPRYMCELTKFIFDSNVQLYNMNNHPCNDQKILPKLTYLKLSFSD